MFGFFKRLSLFRVIHRTPHASGHWGHRHRHLRRAAFAAACGVCLAGGVALAHPPGEHCGGRGPGGPEGHGMHEHAGVWLDGLLVEIGATDKQKTTAHAARDEVLAAMDRAHQGGKGEMDAALKLFAADTLDEKAIQDLRLRFQAKHAEVHQVVLAGVLKIHDQLDATQRDKLVAALKDFRPEARAGFGAAIGKRMIEGRIEQALDRVKADDKQRAAVHATAQRVMQAFADQTATRQALFDEALTLLAQPKIDQATLQKLVARHDADRHAMGDQFIQAARDVHAVLRPEQRAALVKGFAERMEHWRGR
jgi:Spy/CpxP family protein refolding chaperone